MVFYPSCCKIVSNLQNIRGKALFTIVRFGHDANQPKHIQYSKLNLTKTLYHKKFRFSKNLDWFLLFTTRVAESEVKCSTPTPTFPKFPTPDSTPYHSEWNLTVNNFIASNTHLKSWYTARIICFNKSFIRNCTISTGIPNIGVWCKKWSSWISAVGQKIRLLLLTPPTPQHCSQRFQVGSHRRLEKRYLRPVQPRAQGWWMGAREQFTRGAVIDSPTVQHLTAKAAAWPTAQASGNGHS